MTTKSPAKTGLRALWFSPVVITVVGFFALLHWWKPRNATFVLVLGAVASIFVMGYTSFIARRAQRHLDEVQLASRGFANSRGWVWGAMATVVLLMLPPVTNWLIDLADRLTAGMPDMATRHHAAVQLGLSFGFMLVVLMQGIGVCVAASIWWRRMGARTP